MSMGIIESGEYNKVAGMQVTMRALPSNNKGYAYNKTLALSTLSTVTDTFTIPVSGYYVIRETLTRNAARVDSNFAEVRLGNADGPVILQLDGQWLSENGTVRDVCLWLEKGQVLTFKLLQTGGKAAVTLNDNFQVIQLESTEEVA